MNGYINSFGENNKNKNTIIMPFKVKDRQLLKNYNKIRKKIKRLMSIDFDSKPVYGNDDAINIMNGSNLSEKRVFYNFFCFI